jgi:glucose/arabinose dehydrogenase/uncharacterized membrane protein
MSPWEIHPSLVHFPLAFLIGGVLLDMVAWFRPREGLARAATWLLVAGVVTGLGATGAGVLAFFTVPAHTEEAHGMMYWHSSFAVVSLALFSGVIFARWRRRDRRPSLWTRLAGLAAAALLSVAGYLGGYIVYHGGAGIEPRLLASTLQQGHKHGRDREHREGASAQSSKSHPHNHHGESRQRTDSQVPHKAGPHLADSKRAPEQLPAIPAPDAKAAQAPPGYLVEVAFDSLTYPTSIEIDDAGTIYLAEGGYIYGDDVAPARILRFPVNGEAETAAEHLNGPVTDLLWHDDRLYISHRGKVSVLEASGLRDLVTGLPSEGDHHNNQLTVGPDGKLYFGQGVATNSGVVGLDNFKMGWLAKYPDVHDIPPKDIRLTDQAFATPDPLAIFAEKPKGHVGHETGAKDTDKAHEHAGHGSNGRDAVHDKGHKHDSAKDKGTEKQKEPADERDHKEHGGKAKESERGHSGAAKEHKNGHRMVNTFAFQPFGKTPSDEGAKPGAVKANGTILRMNLDGSNLEMYAWGLRNPFGVLWGPDGKLYAADNGYDERGSRPIAHAPDCLYEIKQAAWYGFPDYAGGIPVTDARFRPEQGPSPKFLMRDHPAVEKPLLTLAHHVAAAKMDFGHSDQFGFKGQLFLALAGDMNPITGAHEERSGFEVIRFDPDAGKAQTFFKAKKSALGPKGMEYVATAGPRRPVDVRFSPDGNTLYVVDIGAMAIIPTAAGPVPRPFPRTGVVWRITRELGHSR